MNWQLDQTRREILEHPARNKVICAGRRWGKTMLSIMWLLHGHLEPGKRYWFISPTYRQSKTVCWPILRRLFRDLPAKINESELTIHIQGAEVALKGSDNEHGLRGVGLERCVMDEYGFMKGHIWGEIVRPMLADTGGSAFFIGTPNGFSHFWDVWSLGMGGDPEWKSWQYTTAEGGYVTREEVEKAKSQMDERLWRQEFMGSWETVGSRAAYNFDRAVHVKEAKEVSRNKAWGLDMNVDYMTAELSCTYTDDVVHFLKEIRLTNTNTEEMANKMKEIEPGIPVYPDPAGSARSTQSTKSDHQILRDNDFEVRAKRAHPSHRDRLNALNRKLKDADGKISMTVDPTCKHLIRDLEQCQRDSTGSLNKKDLKLTHALDAATYMIDFLWPIQKRVAQSIRW